VRDPADADLLVIPSLANFQQARGRAGGIKLQYCKGLTPIASIMGVIARTETWQRRQQDHVRVSLDWEAACLPGLPPRAANRTMNRTSSDSLTRADAARRAGLTTCMAGAGSHEPMLRGFVESHVRGVPPSLADAGYERCLRP
jgi:hypothetical protein